MLATGCQNLGRLNRELSEVLDALKVPLITLLICICFEMPDVSVRFIDGDINSLVQCHLSYSSKEIQMYRACDFSMKGAYFKQKKNNCNSQIRQNLFVATL